MENDWDLNKSGISNWSGRKSAVVVAHPDDETLWCGGIMLMRPEANWHIITLCRGSDTDRAPKFRKILTKYKATGVMADMDDGPDQTPLDILDVSRTLLSLLPDKEYDIIITHSPRGEYTRHKRHEEVAEAVLLLIKSYRLLTNQLWMFAYEDGGRCHLPQAIETADLVLGLPEKIRQIKYDIVTVDYGFAPESWEARTTPQTEAYWIFETFDDVYKKIDGRSVSL